MTGPTVLEAPDAGEWKLHAACRHEDPDLFFPDPSDSFQALAAKRVCRGCPVSAQCLQAGLRERHGIWAGLTPHQRARLRHGAEASA